MAEILSIFGEFGTLFLVLYKYLHVIEEFDLLLTKSRKEKSRELDPILNASEFFIIIYIEINSNEPKHTNNIMRTK